MTAVDQHLLLRALVDELARCGMRQAATAAGSRNTPIIEALVNAPEISSVSHIDERCAGFFAVGATRASGQPVAVTATSGTAVANLLPAVVEASEAGLPLIILSADRPAELRQIGAGQTIDQVKIFGAYTRFFAELDLYEASPTRARWVRAMACRAYWRAVAGPDPGPVHLNLPLREPLIVDSPLPPDPVPGRAGGRPWVSAITPTPSLPEADRQDLPPRTVVVAGACSPEVADAAVRFCERHQIPLLADPLSGARRGSAAIAHYDLLLRDPAFIAVTSPKAILRVGDLPTSKPLRAWLASRTDATQVSISTSSMSADPASVISATLAVDPVTFFASATLASPPDGAWLAAWGSADRAVAAAIETHLDRTTLSEPLVAQLLGSVLPATATLFVASSMPIRDVEQFFTARDDPPRVLANRGANGIDGTVSSAFGATAADPGSETVLLIGDVALAHDIGGLLTGPRTGLKLTVVLINNNGGGIFSFLPIAGVPSAAAAFNDHIATPHGLDFRLAAALYSFTHVAAADAESLTAALAAALAGPQSTIIEIRTDRAENRRLHAEIAAAALRAFNPPGRAEAPGA